jgi:DNA-3-methyladenine glycosylase II
MTHPPYWPLAKEYLSKQDKILKKVIDNYTTQHLVASDDAFITLARSIVGQQISVKAAESIWQRVANFLPEFCAANVIIADADKLKELGLSRQKILYLKNIAQAFLIDSNFWQDITSKHNDELIEKLVAIKGIGRWTAEMFLIFHMNRPNILPLQDVGLIKSIEKLYNNNGKLNKSQIIEIAKAWHPYCTVATWYLWRSLTPQIVAY